MSAPISAPFLPPMSAPMLEGGRAGRSRQGRQHVGGAAHGGDGAAVDDRLIHDRVLSGLTPHRTLTGKLRRRLSTTRCRTNRCRKGADENQRTHVHVPPGHGSINVRARRAGAATG